MDEQTGPVDSLSAVTLVTSDMAASVGFYDAMGFERLSGGPEAPFTSYRIGTSFLNIQWVERFEPPSTVWGRAIFWVDDVDSMHRRALDAGFAPLTAPSDAPWGERYFHIHDPAGHELSFARPLDGR